MRPMQLLVLVESALLVILGLAWCLRLGDDVALPSSSPSAGASVAMADGTALAAERRDTAGATMARATDETRRRDATTGDGRVLLRGRLVPTDGSGPPEDGRMWLRRGGSSRRAELCIGDYAAPGMGPGEWSVSIDCDDFARVETTVTLDSDPVQVRDFALSPAPHIAVQLRTPDDEPLLTALPKEASRQLGRAISVIATVEPLRADLPPTDNTLPGDIGVGRFRAQWNNYANGTGVPAGADGLLLLDRQPPVSAALLLRNVIVQQQAIVPGQDLLRFVVDPAALSARTCTVRIRIVDENGAPLEGVAVGIGAAQGGGVHAMTGADGTAVVRNALPGIGRLVVAMTGRESHRSDLLLAPGEVDLGTSSLARPVALRGRLVDADGAPVRGTLSWTDLDATLFPTTLVDYFNTSTADDGTFALDDVGPHRWTLLARSSDDRCGHATVDTRGGDGGPVEIRVQPAGRVEVATRGGLEGYLARLVDSNGTVAAAERIEPRWPVQTLRAVRGDYTLEVFDHTNRLVHTGTVHLGAEPQRVEVR